MSVLEATVEITKAILSSGGEYAGTTDYLLINDEQRKNMLDGIKELYKTVKELNAN
jgi:hypothetical protein